MTVLFVSVCFLFLAQEPPVGYRILIHEVPRSHSDTPHSVGIVWTSHQLVTVTSTGQHTTQRQKSMSTVGFEPTISGDERPQTYALDRAATGTGLRDG